MRDELVRMVEEDLCKCNLCYKAIANVEFNDEERKQAEMIFSDYTDIYNMFIGMKARYSALISDFPDDIDWDRMKNNEDEFIEEKTCQYLRKVIEKLNTFKIMGYSEIKMSDTPKFVISNQNINTNTNDNSLISTNISIQEAKQKIENMSALNDDEIEEILKKIEELEAILKSTDRKSKKWANAKGIVKWIADKSFEVAKIIIPLVLKIDS